VLRTLGQQKGLLGQIFTKSQNKIQDPAKLARIIDLVDREKWSTQSVCAPLHLLFLFRGEGNPVKEGGDVITGLVEFVARESARSGIVDDQRILLPFAFFGSGDGQNAIDVEVKVDFDLDSSGGFWGIPSILKAPKGTFSRAIAFSP